MSRVERQPRQRRTAWLACALTCCLLSTPLAQEARDKLAAEAELKRKALEDELAAKLVVAESQIAATRAQAMTNVETIARDAAGAIF